MANVLFFEGAGAEKPYVTRDIPIVLMNGGTVSFFSPVVRQQGNGDRHLALAPCESNRPSRLMQLSDDTYVVLGDHQEQDGETVRLMASQAIAGGAAEIGFKTPGLAEVVAQFRGGVPYAPGQPDEPDISIKLPSAHLSYAPRIQGEFSVRYPGCGKMGGGGPAGGNYPGVADSPFIFAQMLAKMAADNGVPFVSSVSSQAYFSQVREQTGHGAVFNRPPAWAREVEVGRHVQLDRGGSKYQLARESFIDSEDDSLLAEAARMILGFKTKTDRYAAEALDEIILLHKASANVGPKMDEINDIDLFDRHEDLPAEIQAVMEKYNDIFDAGVIDPYESCKQFLAEVRKLGYTFEYGLDAEPHSLRVDDLDDLDDMSVGPR